jgi:imidazole glycerol-phosphate synthase subunit HisF
MLKKRVIFTLLYDNGSFMLSRNFRLQRVGKLDWLQKNYDFSQIAFSIDELVVLDVSRNKRDEKKFYHHVRSLNDSCFVPIAAGGGIRTLKQAQILLQNGAEKIVVNTLLSENPEIVREISIRYGQQCIVAVVDVKEVNGKFTIWTDNGTVQQQIGLAKWLEDLQNFPIGEIYLNSIDRDGTGQGFHTELLEYLPEKTLIPIILAGGAGIPSHLGEGLKDPRVDAVATAHLFNFVGNGLEQARIELLDEGFNLARWEIGLANSLKNVLA